MNIVSTIIPIFTIILLGWIARRRQFIQTSFMEPANRLVYYLAIPAMVFRSTARASLQSQFDERVLAIALCSILLIFSIAWIAGFIMRNSRRKMGTFVQNSVHGNLGYIGLAVSFYYLGNEGFIRASLLAGFMMVLQNLLSVIILQVYEPNNSLKRGPWCLIFKILENPIIWSAALGIIFSLLGWKIPLIIDRCLNILSGLALPMALLIIGASLSFQMMRMTFFPVIITGVFKLILLPSAGLMGFYLFDLRPENYLPALILLASPTATVTYVMANEMEGDADFAAAAISLNTMLSAITFSMWLKMAA